MVMPHFMFYAPRVDNSDIGGVWDAHSPYAISSQGTLDKEHSIFNYIILPAGDTEKAEIIEKNKNLLRRLAEYRSCLVLSRPLQITIIIKPTGHSDFYGRYTYTNSYFKAG